MNPIESHRKNSLVFLPGGASSEANLDAAAQANSGEIVGKTGLVKSTSGPVVPVKRTVSAKRTVPTKRTVPARNRVSTSRFISSRAEATRVRSIGNLIGQLISRRGYASTMADDHLAQSVREAVASELAASFRIGKLRAGVLQIFVTDSVTLQEFNFQKRQIIKRLAKDHPDKVKDLRFKISDDRHPE
jgi:hypothetical protein